jgi:hypothetical protein
VKIKANYVLRTVAKEHIVVPIGSEAVNFNGVLSLNSTGKWLWEQLQTEVSLESLIASMVETYQVDELTAKTDILAFINKLKVKAIIE